MFSFCVLLTDIISTVCCWWSANEYDYGGPWNNNWQG